MFVCYRLLVYQRVSTRIYCTENLPWDPKDRVAMVQYFSLLIWGPYGEYHTIDRRK